MTNDPVHWAEGMFLRPHHFQAAERSWTELLTSSEGIDHQYNYGVRRVTLSPEALTNHQIELQSCQARMRDGTLISIGPEDKLDRLDLQPAFAVADRVTIYLAVPRLKSGVANVAAPGMTGTQRYRAFAQSVQDESRGGNDRELEYRRLNVRLMRSTDDFTGYERLEIARVQRAGDREATPRLDPEYFPPMLAVDAWPPLALDTVRAIYDIIGKKIEMLSQQVLSRNIGFSGNEPGDLDRLWMLSHLNESSATLATLVFADGIHPLWMYTELCRIVGRLGIFDASRRTPELPRYDHDDLARIFRAVKDKIQVLLGAVQDYQYEQRYFVGAGKGLQVTLEPKWFNSDWKWFVGVDCEEPMKKICETLLSRGGLADWKLASSEEVEAIFSRRSEGLTLQPIPQHPRPLPSGWLYFQVQRSGPVWDSVQRTQTLAMRIKQELIQHIDKLQGERKLVLKLANRETILQFALFAVPSRA